MITNCLAFVRRALNDQRGQVIPWVTGGMFAFMGMAGLTIDIGHAYAVRAQFQNSTNAAALAAANAANVSQTPLYEATLVSAASGPNASPYYTAGSLSVTQLCLNMLQPNGLTCTSNPINNAVKVSQSASVPTYFLGAVGITTIPLKTTALASDLIPNNWNIAIIEDATGSMATVDSNCPGGSVSEFQCALNSIQTILAKVNPCPGTMTSCTPDQANIRVALFTFPNMVTKYLPTFYKSGCSSNLSSITPPAPFQVMTLPKENASSYTPLTYSQATTPTATTWTASYELTWGAQNADAASGYPGDPNGVDANGFVSDYYSPGNTVTGNLNPNSPLVRLVGYGGNGGGTGTGSGSISNASGGAASGSAAPCMPISESGIDLNGATNPGSTIPSITSTANGGTQATSSTTVNTLGVGEGITYYAAAIYAAQAALTAEQAAYPLKQSKNAIILLSDGQANTQWIYFPAGSQKPGAVNTSLKSTIVGSGGYDTTKSAPLLTAKVASGLPSPNSEVNGAISGVYPDFMDECQQAIVAAQYAASSTNAASLASRVIAIAYGSEQKGCGTGSGAATDAHNDVTTVATGNVTAFTAATLTPCITMENIASDKAYFYSDWTQSGSGVDTSCQGLVGLSTDISNLTQIAFQIAAGFESGVLLPVDAS